MTDPSDFFKAVEKSKATKKRERLFTFVDLAPVESGQVILIAATRLSEDEHSVIQFVTKSPSLAFHFSIRKDVIVRNHREGENFDDSKEERDQNLCDSNNKQPIKKDKPFLVSIFMGEEKFYVAIDEKCFCTFKYRVPIREITRIESENLLNITQVDQRSLHPKMWPPAPYISPDVIFSNDLPCVLKQPYITIIMGKVIGNNKSQGGTFDLHFQAKNTSRELFLMRISFEKGTVDLKAMDKNGKYVNEETKNYPFVMNEIFRIGISFKESEFDIAIDGQSLGAYKYVEKDILEQITGPKMRMASGLKFDLYSVEHLFSPTNDANLPGLTELPDWVQEGEKTEFSAGLCCPIQLTHSIIAVGTTDNETTKPTIHLRTNGKGTVALALVVDFKGKMISRNTQKDGTWGSEETTENLFDKNNPNPIVPEKEFKICFMCGHDKFFISINDHPYCTYKHRLKPEDITQIEIKSIRKIKALDHHTILPSPWPVHQELRPSTELDFCNDIPIKFTPGHVVVIGGVPSGKGWFIINFYDKICHRNLMHFNVRFDQNIVVRAWKNQKCDFADREDKGGFPFRFDRRFRIAIGFKKDGFIFAVDGKNFCEYKYRDKVLEDSTGMKLLAVRGMTIKIHEVSHCYLDPECKGIEAISLLSPEKLICPSNN